MAFPVTPLDAMVELNLGGTWTDVTADTYTRSPISITRGRQNEQAQPEPTRCSLTVNNRSGTYSPDNPISPLYGVLGDSTPVRVSVPDSAATLWLDETRTGYLSTPHAAALNITGDIDIRVEFDADLTGNADLNQAIIGKWGTTPATRSWMIRAYDGVIYFNFLDAAQVAHQAFMTTDVYGGGALRITLDVDNGAGGWTANWYHASSLDGPWESIGGPVSVSGTTSIQATTSDVRIGASDTTTGIQRLPFIGTATRAQIRSGIDGTIVANPDITVQAAGATLFTDSAGRTWTVTAPAVISKRDYRFTGEISSWPVDWDVSGEDAWVQVEAAGPGRRMAQGASPLQSTLRRRIPTFSPVAYWPFEDGARATQAASPIAGVRPARVDNLEFGAESTLAGSDALPTLRSQSGSLAYINAPVPSYVSSGSWRVEMAVRNPSSHATAYSYLRVSTAGTVAEWRVQMRNDIGRVIAFDSDGNTLMSQDIAWDLAAFTPFGPWIRIKLFVTQSGGNIQWSVVFEDVDGAFRNFLDQTFAGTNGRVLSVGAPGDGYADAIDGTSIGHLAVFNLLTTAAFTGADNGYDGELAATRMSRLASEEGLPLTLRGVPAEQQKVGPQKIATLLDNLQAPADSDGGILIDRRDRQGFLYRDKVTLYNQTPVVVSYGQLQPGLRPVRDDQALRNDVTVQRDGGSSGRYVETEGRRSALPWPDGAGPYDTSVTLSLYRDEQTEQIAAWLAHLGTTDHPRYPTVNIALEAVPSLMAAVAALDVGDRLQITDGPIGKVPPGAVDLLVQGYTEVIDQLEWTFAFVCSPAEPWTIGLVDDAGGRVDTGGSSLAAAATATATTLSVASTGAPWTTAPSDMPFDITVAGEQMRVTNVTGTSSPQTVTVIRSINGVVKPQLADADVRLAYPCYLAL